jgi:hypothetical protein
MKHTAITVPSTQQWFAVPSEFSPSYISLVPECLRDLIVAGRSRKSSAALVAD